jgi:outer membrane protein assembly factor BamB
VGSESGYLNAFANPDLAVEFGSLIVSERFTYEGETLDVSAKVFNNGSIKMSGNANFYFHLTITQPSKRLVKQELIKSFEITLDIDEEMMLYTTATVPTRDWSTVTMSTVLIKIENVSFPEKSPVEFNNLDFEIIDVLETYTNDWMSYQKDVRNSGLGNFGAKTNKTIWEFDTGTSIPSQLKGSPLHAKGRVFVGSTNGILFSILDSTGKKDWQYNAGSPIQSAPVLLMSKTGVIDFEKIFFATASGNVIALTTNRGDLNWSYATGETIIGSAIVANGTVYIGTDSNTLFALDEDGFYDGDQGLDDANESLTRGDVLWKKTLSGPIISSPAIASNLIILATSSSAIESQLIALDRFTGIQNWSYTFDSSCSAAPIVDDGNEQVFIGMNNQKMYALDLNGLLNGNQGWTGETAAVTNNADVLWSYNVGSNVPSTGAFDAANKRLIFGALDGLVISLNSGTGNLRWKYPGPGQVLASPTIADGLVYVTSDSGIIYCLDEFRIPNTTNTTLIWEFDTGSMLTAPAIENNYATYVGTEDGILYKLGAPNFAPVAIITEPAFNQTYFETEEVILNANSSYDPEGDPKLRYV